MLIKNDIGILLMRKKKPCPICGKLIKKSSSLCRSCEIKRRHDEGILKKSITLDKDFLVEQYVSLGKSVREISKEFNLSSKVIYKNLKKYGLIRNRSEARKITLSKHNVLHCNCRICKIKRGELNFKGKNNFFFSIDENKRKSIIERNVKFLSEFNKNRKNKTYEEIYGEDKAKIIKQKQSESRKGKKHSLETKLKISKNRKGKPAWNKGIKNSTSKYWLNKSNKFILVKHHIDGNHNNNDKNNILIVPQYLHRSLHWKAYEYLVIIGLVRDYLKDFIIKYDIDISCDDGKVVHHIDCNRNNNSKDNLVYLKDKSLHNKIHQEAYLYLVKIDKINEYISWFLKEKNQLKNDRGGRINAYT